jgi:uncharacterized protein (TIGR03083 family)
MTDVSRLGPKVDARPLFERDRAALLQLLRDLDTDDWPRPTAAAPWTVRDIVAHLLGDDVSRLSRSRDHHAGPGPKPGETIGTFLDGATPDRRHRSKLNSHTTDVTSDSSQIDMAPYQLRATSYI